MSYFDKYIKYKTKYLKLKEQMIGGINDYIIRFNTFFGNNWILSGSQAIKLYLKHFKRDDLLTFNPNDVDILYINNDLIYQKNIDGFERVQERPERSLTFKKGNQSFDISIVKGSKYYEIDGIKLNTPGSLLENYLDNIDFSEKPDEDNKKINALKVLVELVKPLEVKKIAISKK